MRVFIYGAGKVGRALAWALRRAGDEVVLRPARKGIPRGKIDASVLIFALRDRDLGPAATAFADAGVVPKPAVCVPTASIGWAPLSVSST